MWRGLIYWFWHLTPIWFASDSHSIRIRDSFHRAIKLTHLKCVNNSNVNKLLIVCKDAGENREIRNSFPFVFVGAAHIFQVQRLFIDQKLFDTTNEHLAAHESKFELKSQAFEWMMSPFEWNYNILGLMNLNILIDFKMLFEQWSKIFAWLEVEIILNRMHSFNRRVNARPIQIFIGNPWISARLFRHRIRFLMHLIL